MACKILCAKKANKAEYRSLLLRELWMQCKKQADDLIRREKKGKRKEEGQEEERTADERNLDINSDSDSSLLNYLRKSTELDEARVPRLWNRHNYTYFINKPKKIFKCSNKSTTMGIHLLSGPEMPKRDNPGFCQLQRTAWWPSSSHSPRQGCSNPEEPCVWVKSLFCFLLVPSLGVWMEGPRGQVQKTGH